MVCTVQECVTDTIVHTLYSVLAVQCVQHCVCAKTSVNAIETNHIRLQTLKLKLKLKLQLLCVKLHTLWHHVYIVVTNRFILTPHLVKWVDIGCEVTEITHVKSQKSHM